MWWCWGSWLSRVWVPWELVAALASVPRVFVPLEEGMTYVPSSQEGVPNAIAGPPC